MKLYISLGRMDILIVLLSSSHDYDSNICLLLVGFLGSSNGKESACNAGDLGLTPGLEDVLEKGMPTHSSILAWRIPWTEEPGRLQSIGLQSQT